MSFSGYIGESVTRLDEKGRIIIPSRFRDPMRGARHHVWFLVPGDHQSILMFPQPVWDQITTDAQKVTGGHPNGVELARHLFGRACDVSPDPQGRMSIAQELRAHAGIDKEGVIVGVGNRLELWNKEAWEAYKQNTKPVYEELARLLVSLSSGQGAATEKGGHEHDG